MITGTAPLRTKINKRHFRSFARSFRAADIVGWLTNSKTCLNRADAVQLCTKLCRDGYLCQLDPFTPSIPAVYPDDQSLWAFQSALLWPSRRFEDNSNFEYAIYLYRRQQENVDEGMLALQPYEAQRLLKIRDELAGQRERIVEGIQEVHK